MTELASADDTAIENRHLDQRVPWEWRAVALGDEALIARSIPEGVAEAFRVVGQTRNVRRLARADAVLFGGAVVEAIYDADRGVVVFQHDYAGRIETYGVDKWLAAPAVQLDRLETVDLAEVLA